jgi:ribonuclease BN (tRNA processing enzyme)
LRVTFLGTGEAFFGGGRGHSALLVEEETGRPLLVDCGATVPLALKRRGLSPATACDEILLTHLHGDHTAGLPFLLLAGVYEDRRSRPLTVIGPPLAARQIEALAATLYPDLTGPRPFEVRYREVSPGGALEAGGRRFSALPAHHMKGEYTALSWRIEAGGKTIAVTGDTGAAAPLAELAAGADLLVCECTLPDHPPGAERPRHLSAAEVARLRPAWTARRVVLTHLSAEARERAQAIPGVEVAEDGLTIEL